MPVSLPYIYQDGDDVTADIFNANFAVVQAKFNGGIIDADCSSQMNLDGVKIALTSIPGNRLVTEAVGTSQLGPLSVTEPKMANDAAITRVIADASVTAPKLKRQMTSVAISAGAAGFGNSLDTAYGTYLALNVAAPATGIAVSNVIATASAIWIGAPVLRKTAGGAPSDGTNDATRVALSVFVDNTSGIAYLCVQNVTGLAASLIGYTIDIPTVIAA